MYTDRPTRRGSTGWEDMQTWKTKRTGARPLIARASHAMSQAADEVLAAQQPQQPATPRQYVSGHGRPVTEASQQPPVEADEQPVSHVPDECYVS